MGAFKPGDRICVISFTVGYLIMPAVFFAFVLRNTFNVGGHFKREFVY